MLVREYSRSVVAVFWLGLALLWFLPLGRPHLFDPDEGRYAEIPREMVASGDWVTPRLDAIKYFEKPPLGYWATAAAFELFGQHAWTVRLWPAVSGLLGLMLTFALARRLYDQRAALLAVVVHLRAVLVDLGSTVPARGLYVTEAEFATLDAAIAAWAKAAVPLIRRALTPG